MVNFCRCATESDVTFFLTLPWNYYLKLDNNVQKFCLVQLKMSVLMKDSLCLPQEKQQLQSDLLESQARIHELERMMNDSGQVLQFH